MRTKISADTEFIHSVLLKASSVTMSIRPLRPFLVSRKSTPILKSSVIKTLQWADSCVPNCCMWAGFWVNLFRYLLCGHKEWFWNIFSKIISKDWILTSSPSANNTRYSDSWSFTNQLNKSRFTFGSRTFTTKHASFSKFWLAGPYYKWITILKQLVTIRCEFSKQNMITVNNKGLFQSKLNFYLCCRTLKCFFKICFYLLSKFSFNFIDPVARIIRKFLTGQIIKVKYSISNQN